MSEENLAPEGEITEVTEAEATEQEVEVDVAEPTEGHEETESSDAKEKPAKPKKPSRAEQRINQLTRERYELERRYNEAMQHLQQMQQRQQQAAPQQQQDFPTLEQYGYDEAQYRQAVQSWHQGQVQQTLQQMQRQAQVHAQQQREAEQAQRVQRMVQEAQAVYPDFHAKVFNPELPSLRQVSPAAFEAVMESDNPAGVVYYLASNPGEVYEFSGLSATRAARKVAQIEARLNAKPTNQRIPPPPPGKLAGKSEAKQKSVLDPGLPIEEFMRLRNRGP